MADELQVSFIGPGEPAAVQARWKAEPPDFLRRSRFKLADEAYDSLVYVERYYDWPQKIQIALSLGLALVFFRSLMLSSFRLTVRFDGAGPGQTRVMILGTAHPQTRRQIAELVGANGGAQGLQVGV